MISHIRNVETYPKTISYESFIPTSDKMKRIVKNACPEMTKQCIMKCYRGHKKSTNTSHGYGQQLNNFGTIAGRQCVGKPLGISLVPTNAPPDYTGYKPQAQACITQYNINNASFNILQSILPSSVVGGLSAIGITIPQVNVAQFTNPTCKGVYQFTDKKGIVHTNTFQNQGPFFPIGVTITPPNCGKITVPTGSNIVQNAINDIKNISPSCFINSGTTSVFGDSIPTGVNAPQIVYKCKPGIKANTTTTSTHHNKFTFGNHTDNGLYKGECTFTAVAN